MSRKPWFAFTLLVLLLLLLAGLPVALTGLNGGCVSAERYNAMKLAHDNAIDQLAGVDHQTQVSAGAPSAHAKATGDQVDTNALPDASSPSESWDKLLSTGEAPTDRRTSPFGARSPATVTRSNRDSGRGEQLAQSIRRCDEELWVIQKPAAAAQADARPANDDVPGSGSLIATPPGEKQLVPVPLKHTDVRASIAGYIASVDVKQQFQNPYSGKIEAVYVFPLPGNAAVNEFVMTVGERKIRGIIREREEAQRIYNEAKSGGYVASLLTQERPNVFTQKVANIEPGKSIDIDVRYFNTLGYSDGWYEFVFPMVVGPRFNPPGTTDGVGAVAKGANGASGQKTEVQYLRPDQRSGHDISLSVDIDAGVAVEKIESTNHAIKVERSTPARATVALQSSDSVPNRDFVLRYKVAGDRTKSGLVAQRDAKGQGYFTLMLIPPENLGSLPERGLEMVFTLDVSGSMSGQPLAQSKNAMRYALTHMNSQDTFQIVEFASNASQMSGAPLAATPENVQRAMAYLEQTSSGGGTMMLEGIRKSLDFPHDENRLRFVSFLTDGYIGNEAEIFKAVKASLGPARVFSFGVGSSTNRYLLDGLARNGRGAVAYLGLNDDATQVMQSFYDRIRRPALTDVKIDWGDMNVSEVFPKEIPDLFVGRPVVITGKFNGGADQTAIRIQGRVGNEVQTVELPVLVESATQDAKALPAVWARMKIADLADEAAMASNADVSGEVKQVALEYGLMSSFTSFVAVDSMTRTDGAYGTTVAVPVPVPEGVRYETTVQNGPGTPQGE
jgi:Ca-activated chloride channel family protein